MEAFVEISKLLTPDYTHGWLTHSQPTSPFLETQYPKLSWTSWNIYASGGDWGCFVGDDLWLFVTWLLLAFLLSCWKIREIYLLMFCAQTPDGSDRDGTRVPQGSTNIWHHSRRRYADATKAFKTNKSFLHTKKKSCFFKTVKTLANRTQNTLNMYVFLI